MKMRQSQDIICGDENALMFEKKARNRGEEKKIKYETRHELIAEDKFLKDGLYALSKVHLKFSIKRLQC